jgi:hypothetical protein
VDRLVADYRRIAQLADDIDRLVRRLDLGDAHYLRGAMRLDVTGHQGLSDACAEFEHQWSFGRDRLGRSLQQLIEFLVTAAEEYEAADAQAAAAARSNASTADPVAPRLR